MIRFKVVKGSRVLLTVAIAVLVLVLCAIALGFVTKDRTPARDASASLVQADNAEEVFASSAGPGAVEGIEVQVVPESPAPEQKHSVLIYHTHTHEAYEQVKGDPYDAVEAWRTTDADHSVVRVGAELAARLEALGFEVVHDTTDHESDELSTAYERSLQTLKGYDRAFDLYIDLHRDAFVDGMKRAFTLESGTVCAQPMLLIGNGSGFDVKPHYEENLAFAESLTKAINDACPGLCKPVLVKDRRYNQHIGVYSVLIEVGHNKNTLQEALNAVPYIAEGIKHVFDALS